MAHNHFLFTPQYSTFIKHHYQTKILFLVYLPTEHIHFCFTPYHVPLHNFRLHCLIYQEPGQSKFFEPCNIYCMQDSSSWHNREENPSLSLVTLIASNSLFDTTTTCGWMHSWQGGGVISTTMAMATMTMTTIQALQH